MHLVFDTDVKNGQKILKLHKNSSVCKWLRCLNDLYYGNMIKIHCSNMIKMQLDWEPSFKLAQSYSMQITWIFEFHFTYLSLLFWDINYWLINLIFGQVQTGEWTESGAFVWGHHAIYKGGLKLNVFEQYSLVHYFYKNSCQWLMSSKSFLT